MTNTRQIINARADETGNIIAVQLEGNNNYTNINQAIAMAKNGKLDAVVVTKKNDNRHL